VQVRVLNCDGTGATDAIVQAIAWVIANRQDPAIISLSLGGPASPAFDDAVSAAVASGIPVKLSVLLVFSQCFHIHPRVSTVFITVFI
jgi:subtilisin family serine protease